MTEYSKKIFGDKALLREKMAIFLGDSNLNATEDYARAAELFFASGAKAGLKFAPTWSWWAFLGGFWFLLYDYILCAVHALSSFSRFREFYDNKRSTASRSFIFRTLLKTSRSSALNSPPPRCIFL